MAQTEIGSRRPGFKKVELLIVLVLLVGAIGLAFPLVQMVRRSAERLESANNLRIIVLSLQSTHDAHRMLPPAIGYFPVQKAELLPKDPLEQQPSLHGTVFFHIFPFVEASPIWPKAIGMSRTIKDVYMPMWYSPADFTLPPYQTADGQSVISYAANGYVLGGGTCNYENNGKAYFSQITLGEITAKDGISNTIAFGERFARCNAKESGGNVIEYERAWSEDGKDRTPWSPVVWRHDLLPQFGAAMTDAGGLPCDPEALQAFHSWSIQVVMFDGHVRSVSSNVSQETWSNAMRHDDGNKELGEDF
jgi:hypothetical protein